MSILDLIATANHNLFRNKTRTILTIIAVFIGSFTIILSNAINTGVNDFIDKQVESIGGDGYIEVSPKAVYDQLSSLTSGSVQEYNEDSKSIETSTLDEETLNKLRAIDGVDSLIPYNNISVDYITSDKTDKKYKANVGLLADDSVYVDMQAGRQPNSKAEQNEIILTEEYAKKLGYDDVNSIVDREIILGIPNTLDCMTTNNRTECQRKVTTKVVGIAAAGVMNLGSGIRANPALYSNIVDVQYAGLPSSQKTAYSATGHIDQSKLDSIRTAFDKEGFTIMTIDDEVGVIRNFLDAILVVFNIFGGIALLAAAIGIINTLYMSVQERTREIGLMKAMGMSSSRIFLAFSFEAILLGFWGSVVGIIISMLIGFAADSFAHSSFLADLPTFHLVVFNPVNMLQIILIIMLIAFIAGTAPAYRASKKNPIDSLRYE